MDSFLEDDQVIHIIFWLSSRFHVFLLSVSTNRFYSISFFKLIFHLFELHHFRHSCSKGVVSWGFKPDPFLCRLEVGRQDARGSEVCDHCSSPHLQLGPPPGTFFRFSFQDENPLAWKVLVVQSSFPGVFQVAWRHPSQSCTEKSNCPAIGPTV